MRRILLAGALIASILGSAAGSPGQLDPFWTLLVSIWSGSSADVGCGMDPNGRCIPPQTPQTDEGCGMDPDGRCNLAQTPETDVGCGWDPNGRCNPGS